MANRSDRGGEAPNRKLAYQGRDIDWFPARLFHPGQEMTAPVKTGRRYDCSQTSRLRQPLSI